MSGKHAIATVTSRHLHSPKEEMKVSEQNDNHALWIGLTSDSKFANTFDSSVPVDPLNFVSSGHKQKNPNSSIIKTHKSKYQGLIKQRTTKGINSPNGSDSGS